jgi:hypothetical protein
MIGERTTKRVRGAADDARHDPHTGPVEIVREGNLREAAEGKQIEGAKL